LHHQTLKTKKMKTLKTLSIALTLGAFIFSTNVNAQKKETIAILDLHAINMFYKSDEITRLLRSEATKLDKYSVLDVYEMKEQFANSKFKDGECFSKRCGISAGVLLKVNYVTTGSIERFGGKIIVTLNLIDIKSEDISKQIVMEFINKEDEIQRMLRVSIQKLLTDNADTQLTAELVHIELPVNNPNNLISLNGPRMGASIITGTAGKRLTANQDDGGFEMLGIGSTAITTTMGYQWETRYIATNNFQALVEVIAVVGGMEVGKINPSITLLNGLRFSNSNWEFGFGPSFRLKRVSNGYYDANGVWHLERDWNYENGENPHKIERGVLDYRGYLTGDMGMIFALGKTFQSGRLNIPVNIFYAPKRTSSTIGVSVGFNIQKPK
jgi:TolB-like protein